MPTDYLAYTVFILATSEPCQTSLVQFSEADISITTGTWQVPVSILISAFKMELNQSGTVLKERSISLKAISSTSTVQNYHYIFVGSTTLPCSLIVKQFNILLWLLG